MSNLPDDDPENGPNFLVLIIVLVILAFGCAWMFTKLKSANNLLYCVVSWRHNCGQIQQ